MPRFLLFITLVAIVDLSAANAQLFGRPRNLGRPLSNQNGPSAQEDVGTLSGNERFLRGNRGRSAFVGADRNEGQGFVGNVEARTSGTIVSSIAGMTPARDQSTQINQPLTSAAAGELSLPKLRLNLGSPPRPPIADMSVFNRVQYAASLVVPVGISTSVVGRTAILRGLARSVEERNLVETMVSFEPGISRIENLIETPPPAPLPGPAVTPVPTPVPDPPAAQEPPTPDQPLPSPRSPRNRQRPRQRALRHWASMTATANPLSQESR